MNAKKSGNLRPVSSPISSQTELYRKWSPGQRLQAAAELYQFAKAIIQNRERRLNPALSEEELEEKVRTFFR